MKSETDPKAWGFLAGAYFFMFCLLVAFWGSGCGDGAPHVTSAPRAAKPNVNKLMIVHEGDRVGHCTAWKAGKDRIFTAGHCCEEGLSYYFEDSGMSPSVAVDDDVHDVCVMRGEMSGRTISLAAFDPAMGEYVWTAGYPSYPLVISGGFWSGRTEINDNTYGTSSVVAQGGASGSPLLNADGYAVGMVVAGYLGSGDNVTLSAAIEWLRLDYLLSLRED